MNFDWTSIIALSAVISPVVVAFINNYYQIKFKRIDNFDNSKRLALEAFSKSAGEYFSHNTAQNHSIFYNNFYSLLTYFDIDDKTLNILQNENRNSTIEPMVRQLIIKLSKQINTKPKLSIMNIFHK